MAAYTNKVGIMCEADTLKDIIYMYMYSVNDLSSKEIVPVLAQAGAL